MTMGEATPAPGEYRGLARTPQSLPQSAPKHDLPIPHPFARYHGLSALLGEQRALLLVHLSYWQLRGVLIDMGGRTYREYNRDQLWQAICPAGRKTAGCSFGSFRRWLDDLTDRRLITAEYNRSTHRLEIHVDLVAVACLEPQARRALAQGGECWHRSYFPALASTAQIEPCPDSNNDRAEDLIPELEPSRGTALAIAGETPEEPRDGNEPPGELDAAITRCETIATRYKDPGWNTHRIHGLRLNILEHFLQRTTRGLELTRKYCAHRTADGRQVEMIPEYRHLVQAANLMADRYEEIMQKEPPSYGWLLKAASRLALNDQHNHESEERKLKAAAALVEAKRERQEREQRLVASERDRAYFAQQDEQEARHATH